MDGDLSHSGAVHKNSVVCMHVTVDHMDYSRVGDRVDLMRSYDAQSTVLGYARGGDEASDEADNEVVESDPGLNEATSTVLAHASAKAPTGNEDGDESESENEEVESFEGQKDDEDYKESEKEVDEEEEEE